MAIVYKFPTRAEAEKNISYISKLFTDYYENFKTKQDDLTYQKITTLHKQAYKYYYDLIGTKIISEVDLPPFLYEDARKRKAYDYASLAIFEVIKDNRVNECYSKCIRKSVESRRAN